MHTLAANSIAPMAGLSAGDVVLSINGIAISTHGEAVQLIDNASDEIVLGLASTSRAAADIPMFQRRPSSDTFALDESSQKGILG